MYKKWGFSGNYGYIFAKGCLNVPIRIRRRVHIGHVFTQIHVGQFRTDADTDPFRVVATIPLCTPTHMGMVRGLIKAATASLHGLRALIDEGEKRLRASLAVRDGTRLDEEYLQLRLYLDMLTQIAKARWPRLGRYRLITPIALRSKRRMARRLVSRWVRRAPS